MFKCPEKISLCWPITGDLIPKHLKVKVTSYSFVIFVGLHAKCKIFFVLSCFWHIHCIPALVVLPLSFFVIPSEMMDRGFTIKVLMSYLGRRISKGSVENLCISETCCGWELTKLPILRNMMFYIFHWGS